MTDSLQHHGLQPTRLFCPWNSPGKNPRVGYHFLLQRISGLGTFKKVNLRKECYTAKYYQTVLTYVDGNLRRACAGAGF